MTQSEITPILTPEDGPAAQTENPEGRSPVLLVCEHASNALPRMLGTLGLKQEVLESHIAWDPGAYDVARALAQLLDATLISARFSRLAYDVNRPPDSAQAIRTTSELYDIPGNQGLKRADRHARAEGIYEPFHDALAARIAARTREGRAAVLINIHSFTPVYYGAARRVQLGILHDEDARLADRILGCADRFTELITLRNEPYGPADEVTHTLAKHAVPHGLLNVMIEIRNDLIRTPGAQVRMAELLATMLRAALMELGVPMDEGASHASRH